MELKIEKLVYGGDGLARLPSPGDPRAGKAVFVPFTVPGETVGARIAEKKPGFARARVEKILQPSPDRVQPSCPYFGDCGGCQYQHMTYAAQLYAKADILRETLQRTAKLNPPEIVAHASPPWNYRNRTRMRVQTQRGFAIGYNRFASHVLLPVRECPISSPLINRALTAIWKLGESGLVPEGVNEIEFFANAEDTELLLEVTFAPGHQRRNLRALTEFAGLLREKVPEVRGVVPFSTSSGPAQIRIDVPPEMQSALGGDSLSYRTRGGQYQVSAGSFFQTNRYLIDSMIALTTDGFSGDFALDLYAGVGLFTLQLSQTFREVAAVEIAPFAFHDLHANSPSNAKGYRVNVDRFLANVHRMETNLDAALLEDVVLDPSIDAEGVLLEEGGANASHFDYVLVDPPRAGLGESVAKAVSALKAPRVTYVSCDPATLARDLKILTAAGYRLTALHLLDLFPQTFHIETVAQLSL